MSRYTIHSGQTRVTKGLMSKSWSCSLESCSVFSAQSGLIDSTCSPQLLSILADVQLQHLHVRLLLSSKCRSASMRWTTAGGGASAPTNMITANQFLMSPNSMSFGTKTQNRSLLPERGPLKPTAVDPLQDTMEDVRQTDQCRLVHLHPLCEDKSLCSPDHTRQVCCPNLHNWETNNLLAYPAILNSNNAQPAHLDQIVLKHVFIPLFCSHNSFCCLFPPRG